MRYTRFTILVVCVSLATPYHALGDGLPLDLGPEEIVQADGFDIAVSGYSVPAFADWNNDGLRDLIVGEGGGSGTAKVRVYLNVGTESDPQFSNYFYAGSNGFDLTCPAAGCLGCFPRITYWDADDRKDLLIGQADGSVKVFLNTGTDEEPTFDGATFLQVGKAGSKSKIDVGNRATPSAVDWNSDGRKDLVAGALDGKIHIFINEGTDTEPDFIAEIFAQEDGADLLVPGSRSSPVLLDLDGDGRKDILTGNTYGELLFYSNVGTDEEPSFSGYQYIEAGGAPIDLAGSPRSRPFVGYWTGDGHFGPIDGYFDVLIGAGDGKVRLYRGIPIPADLDLDGDVDFTDFALFSAHWQEIRPRP
jgi:hypothetical protein